MTRIRVGDDIRKLLEMSDETESFDDVKNKVFSNDSVCYHCNQEFMVDLVVENYILTSVKITGYSEKELSERKMIREEMFAEFYKQFKKEFDDKEIIVS